MYILLSVLDMFMCFAGLAIFESMVEKHLVEAFEANKKEISLTFFLLGLAYTITSPLAACVSLAYNYYY